MLGRGLVTYGVLYTLLVELEVIMNDHCKSQPEVLTPSHLLCVLGLRPHLMLVECNEISGDPEVVVDHVTGTALGERC